MNPGLPRGRREFYHWTIDAHFAFSIHFSNSHVFKYILSKFKNIFALGIFCGWVKHLSYFSYLYIKEILFKNQGQLVLSFYQLIIHYSSSGISKSKLNTLENKTIHNVFEWISKTFLTVIANNAYVIMRICCLACVGYLLIGLPQSSICVKILTFYKALTPVV